MKREDLKMLRTKTGEEIVDDLENNRYSLLDSLGCKKLRQAMLPAGKTTALIVKHLIRKAKRERGDVLWPKSFRTEIVKLLSKISPYDLIHDEDLPANIDGLVIGFNHPSLGEVLRLIALVAKRYPHADYLFPVNLPWYEALRPVLKELDTAGVILTPMITPSTRDKITKIAGDEIGSVADDISKAFNARYLSLCRQFIENDDIIVVAPSAGRQKTVFGSVDELWLKTKIDPSTMSLLASMLTRGAKFSEAKFVPICIKPPTSFNRGLNLFSHYTLSVAEPFSLQEAVSLSKERYGNFNGRKFDIEFLNRIATRMAELNSLDLIAPFPRICGSMGTTQVITSLYKAAT